jgi:hypothetical protein
MIAQLLLLIEPQNRGAPRFSINNQKSTIKNFTPPRLSSDGEAEAERPEAQPLKSVQAATTRRQ